MEKFDLSRYRPVLHKSVCTGEQSVGFRDKQTGKFVEDRLIRTPKDLKAFLKEYGICEKDLKKEW